MGLGGGILMPPYSKDLSRGPAGVIFLSRASTFSVGAEVEALLEMLSRQ